MSYRNKTYVAFASEVIRSYRLMEAWRDNESIDFNFYDAHDLYISRDTSQPETIKRNLRERLKSAKQIVLLASSDCKKKGDDGVSFLAHELNVINEFSLPVVIANLNGSREINKQFIPSSLHNRYSISVSFQPKIIQYALNNYKNTGKAEPHKYIAKVYEDLGL